MPRRALVIATGASVEEVGRVARADDLVIGADGGVDVVLAAGLHPALVVGDLDSASASALARADAAGARVDRRPPDKDESDLELALAAAVAAGAPAVHAVLADGGRLDHQLANLLVLASARWSAATVTATVGRASLWVVRDHLALPLPVGAAGALQAVGAPADGVRTTGLRFPLRGERLEPLAARGIANEVVARLATVEVEGGVVLVVSSEPGRPDRAQPDQAV